MCVIDTPSVLGNILPNLSQDIHEIVEGVTGGGGGGGGVGGFLIGKMDNTGSLWVGTSLPFVRKASLDILGNILI